jgi:RNA polymerase sigma-70 factor (ECF subfamily)
MDSDDIKLVQQAKANPEAFRELYEKYSRKVFNYFYYRVGFHKDIAEDLMQETFVRAYKYLPRFSIRSYSYLAYLMTIAHNLLVDFYRKPKREIPAGDLDNVPAEITEPFEEADRKIAAENLWEALQQLPREMREAVLLRYREDMPIKEIAHIFGKSESTVEKLLREAREKLLHHPYLQDLAAFASVQTSERKPKFLLS